MSKTTHPIEILETQELIQKLIDKGYGDLIDCLLDNEQTCYTKRSRLNKSATSREMQKKDPSWKPKKLDDALLEMREILGDVM